MYAEADTKVGVALILINIMCIVRLFPCVQAAADQLAVDVALQVYERAGGVGASPSL